MRVAFYYHSLSGGGAQRIMTTLARLLQERGVAIDFVLHNESGEFLQEAKKYGRIVELARPDFLRKSSSLIKRLLGMPSLKKLPTTHDTRAEEVASGTKLRTLYHHLTYIYLLWNYYRNQRPDIIIPINEKYSFNALFAARLPGYAPHVIISRHTSFAGRPLLQAPADPRFPRFFYNWLLRKSAKCVVVSEALKDEMIRLREIDDEQRIQVIYNPVVDADHLPLNAPVPDEEWFRQKEMPLILAIGRLTSVKNFPNLLHAFARLRESRAARLFVIGQGEDEGSLRDAIRQLGIEEHVRFIAWTDRPYEYICHSDLFVLSSNHEGLPTVLIEALAAGIPVVSTDCPTGPHEILEGGKLGWLVPTKDPAALAAAMLAALSGNNPATAEQRIRKAADFSFERATDAYMALFEKTLKN